MMISSKKWISFGDLNAFFALFLDNLVNLILLSAILTGIFKMPQEFIFQKMIPGTALGVMIGDLIYTWLAIRLMKKTGRDNVTAMPLGIDTPSTIGLAFAVLGPAFLVISGELKNSGVDPALIPERAATITWYIGMGTMIWMGVAKMIASFAGRIIQKTVPVAALLGSLAGVGVVWLGAHALLEIYEVAIVGLFSLGLIILTLIARFRLPFRIPGAFAAVLLGGLLYYFMGFSGLLNSFGINFKLPEFTGLQFLLPIPQSGGFEVLFNRALAYLPVAIPFGLLTIVGGINVTAGARLSGDDYNTRQILFTEGFATLIAGICGGVSQTTPYIGHSAYKMMGARAGYTLLTGLTIGLGGMLGLVGFLVQLIPKPVVAPILIFIGIEITTLAFRISPKRHAMAVVFAIIPAVLNFGAIQIQSMTPGVHSFMSEKYMILGALSQGYILTAMVFGTVVAFVIDRKILQAAITLGIAALFTLCGLMHSVYPGGDVYLPWLIDAEKVIHPRALTLPYEFAAAYIMMALGLIALFFTGPDRKGKGPVAE